MSGRQMLSAVAIMAILLAALTLFAGLGWDQSIDWFVHDCFQNGIVTYTSGSAHMAYCAIPGPRGILAVLALILVGLFGNVIVWCWTLKAKQG